MPLLITYIESQIDSTSVTVFALQMANPDNIPDITYVPLCMVKCDS